MIAAAAALVAVLVGTAPGVATAAPTTNGWTDVPYRAVDGTTTTYQLHTPAAPPVDGLVVYLDGDGQYAVDHPTGDVLGGDGGLVEQATSRGLAVIAPRSPGTTDAWWQEHPEQNAALVDELTRTVAAHLNATGKPVWLVGYSGGAQLITKHLIPRAPGLCTGGAIIIGGGGQPAALSAAPACPMRWITGTDDTQGYDALADARAGSSAYAAAGTPALISTPAGIDHDEVREQIPGLAAGAIDSLRTR